MTFYLSDEKKNVDGEHTTWEFNVIPEHARRPGCADLTVTIFND